MKIGPNLAPEKVQYLSVVPILWVLTLQINSIKQAESKTLSLIKLSENDLSSALVAVGSEVAVALTEPLP